MAELSDCGGGFQDFVILHEFLHLRIDPTQSKK
jgi:hypothetical protein